MQCQGHRNLWDLFIRSFTSKNILAEIVSLRWSLIYIIMSVIVRKISPFYLGFPFSTDLWMTDMTTRDLIMSMAAVDMIDIMGGTLDPIMRRKVYLCHIAIGHEIGRTIVAPTTINIPAARGAVKQTLTSPSRCLNPSNRTRITVS